MPERVLACRRMALAALHFPEARTLDVSEQDPFRGSPAMSQAPREAAAGYDPAAVVPAAAAMLRRGWLDVSAIVCGGWLPLLMRCLGCADDGIRCSPQAMCREHRLAQTSIFGVLPTTLALWSPSMNAATRARCHVALLLHACCGTWHSMWSQGEVRTLPAAR